MATREVKVEFEDIEVTDRVRVCMADNPDCDMVCGIVETTSTDDNGKYIDVRPHKQNATRAEPLLRRFYKSEYKRIYREEPVRVDAVREIVQDIKDGRGVPWSVEDCVVGDIVSAVTYEGEQYHGVLRNIHENAIVIGRAFIWKSTISSLHLLQAAGPTERIASEILTATIEEAKEINPSADSCQTLPAFANNIHTIAADMASLVIKKNRAYGDSFTDAGRILSILYPHGINPSQYDDALAIVRVIDKLKRIATDKDALGESPWRDVLGYAMLSVEKNMRGDRAVKG